MVEKTESLPVTPKFDVEYIPPVPPPPTVTVYEVPPVTENPVAVL
jgi:hypothetical protein